MWSQVIDTNTNAYGRVWTTCVIFVFGMCSINALSYAKPTPPRERKGAIDLTPTSLAASRPAPTSRPCLQIRGAFDVGSGSTKLKVAQVDVCKKAIMKIIFPVKPDDFEQAVEKVSYKKDLKKSYIDTDRKSGLLSKEILEVGVKAMLRLKALAKKVGATSFAGVATSAFRQAKNGAAVAAQLSQRTGIPVSVISQKQEGMLAYHAVTSMFPSISTDKLLVWDIGGSSMQMIMRSGAKQTHFYLGKLASVPMAFQVAAVIQRKKGKLRMAPNPISARQSSEALLYVKTVAKKEVPKVIQEKASGVTVVGVGGVHFFSVRGQVAPGKGSYSLKALQKGIKDRLMLDDKALAKKNNPAAPQKEMRFIRTQLTNLLLVAGYMSALKIKKVRVASINLANGLFLALQYWK